MLNFITFSLWTISSYHFIEIIRNIEINFLDVMTASEWLFRLLQIWRRNFFFFMIFANLQYHTSPKSNSSLSFTAVQLNIVGTKSWKLWRFKSIFLNTNHANSRYHFYYVCHSYAIFYYLLSFSRFCTSDIKTFCMFAMLESWRKKILVHNNNNK